MNLIGTILEKVHRFERQQGYSPKRVDIGEPYHQELEALRANLPYRMDGRTIVGLKIQKTRCQNIIVY